MHSLWRIGTCLTLIALAVFHALAGRDLILTGEGGAGNPRTTTFAEDPKAQTENEQLRESPSSISRHTQSRHLEAIPEGYFNYTDLYAKFTEPVPIFENPQGYWTGEWAADPTPGTKGKFLQGFSNLNGKVEIYFEYIPRIKKHIAYIKVMDGPYAESRRTTLIVNLKMSTFDSTEASFKLNKSVNTEHHAQAELVNDKLDRETVEYFDLDFEMRVVDTRATPNKPVVNLTQFSRLENTKLTVKSLSKQLGITIDVSATQTTRPLLNKWLAVGVPLVLAAALIFSFVNMILLTDGRQVVLINNNGFELFGLFSLFYFHLSLVFLTYATKMELYKVSYYAVATMFFTKSFMSMVAFFVGMSIDNGLLRRGIRPYMYYFAIGFCFFILVGLLAIVVPRNVFNPNYPNFLAAFYFYPLLQLAMTWYRRKGKKVFDIKYQIFVWGIVSIVGILVKGVYNPYLNTEPNRRVAVFAASVPTMVAFLMYLMNKHGLFFMIPEFLAPDTINYIVPVSKIPMEKLDDFCCVCQGKLKYDPEVAPDEEVGGYDGQESGDSNLMKKSNTLFKAPCGHIFHTICVEGWLEKQRLCPMCKTDIPEVVE